MNINQLPTAADIHGVHLFPPGTSDTARIQYTDRNSQLQQFDLPVDELLWLAYLLALSVKDQKLEARMAEVVKQKQNV